MIKEVKVISFTHLITVVVDSEDQSYVLIGDRTNVKKGDCGYIEFKEGGSMGGFWSYSITKPGG